MHIRFGACPISIPGTGTRLEEVWCFLIEPLTPASGATLPSVQETGTSFKRAIQESRKAQYGGRMLPLILGGPGRRRTGPAGAATLLDDGHSLDDESLCTKELPLYRSFRQAAQGRHFQELSESITVANWAQTRPRHPWLRRPRIGRAHRSEAIA